MAVKDYRELIAWQRAMDFVEAVYRASDCFPRREDFGLTAQLRRAAVSVPSNIAEGHGRNSSAEYARFLSISRGSLKEAETQILIARRLGYIDELQESKLTELSSEVSRLVSGFMNSLDVKRPRR